MIMEMQTKSCRTTSNTDKITTSSNYKIVNIFDTAIFHNEWKCAVADACETLLLSQVGLL